MKIGLFRLPRAAAALVLLAAGGCKLTEVTTAPGEDVIVVEAVLRTDAPRQTVLLHRAVNGDAAGGVDATVTLTDERGESHRLVSATGCYRIDPAYAQSDSLQFSGSCYVEPQDASFWIRPGGTYDLRVETTDGKVILGRTRVPGAYAVPSLPPPAADGTRVCSIPPNTAFTLLWRQSEGAWSYVGDLSIRGLPAALPAATFAIPDPLELRGISVSAADTTLVLPTDFGVFDRFQLNNDLLVAVRDGLPEGSRALLVLAAADRNWVNGVRGGNFNPSGQIRISTVTGDGVGVFGSLTIHRATIVVRQHTSIPRCGG